MKYKSPILKTITLSAVALALSACNDDSNDAQCSLSQEPNTVTLCIQSIPENTPSADEIYLAGTPNGWNAGDNLDKPIITLNREPNGYYSYDLHITVGRLLQSLGRYDTKKDIAVTLPI